MERHAEISRRTAFGGMFAIGAGVLFAPATFASGVRRSASQQGAVLFVYKRVGCDCCNKWVKHLEAAGFQVHATEESELSSVKDRLGVPADLRSCHTGIAQGYVVEGHVPADLIQEIIDQKPETAGLAVPGMPIGSPGMEVEGTPSQPYDIVAFDRAGSSHVYARRE